MKARLDFCANSANFIEHSNIILDAETEDDKKKLGLLCQTGIAAISDYSRCNDGVFSAVLCLPVKKEVFIA